VPDTVQRFSLPSWATATNALLAAATIALAVAAGYGLAAIMAGGGLATEAAPVVVTGLVAAGSAQAAPAPAAGTTTPTGPTNTTPTRPTNPVQSPPANQPTGTGLPATGTVALELVRVHYRIEKVTSTNFSGQPRDAALEKEGDLNGLTGQLPVQYSETWKGGFGRLNGGVEFRFPAKLDVTRQANGSGTGKGQVMVKATAERSNNGLGFPRPTGIWITAFHELTKDDKGGLASGSKSARAAWQGEFDFRLSGNALQPGQWSLGSVTVSMRGWQTRNITLTPIYKLAQPRR
jgi:hypothetical protein